MQKTIQALKATRKFFLNSIAGLTTEQLNKIPTGFNNNIAWNLGHMVAAQQGLCYGRAGLPVVVEEKYFADYKTGTKPERYIGAEEIAAIKELLMTTLDKLEADVQTDLFKDYPVIVTRYEVELKSIEDAVAFIPFHDGLHNGVISAIMRIV